MMFIDETENRHAKIKLWTSTINIKVWYQVNPQVLLNPEQLTTNQNADKK